MLHRPYPNNQARSNKETLVELLCLTILEGKVSTKEEIDTTVANVKRLLAESPDAEFNKDCVQGGTPLALAATSSVPEVVALLLSCPLIDPNAKSSGKTPFHHLCESYSSDRLGGVENLMLFLADHRVDITLGADEGTTTPLYCVCKQGHLDVLLRIINSGKYFNVQYAIGVAEKLVQETDAAIRELADHYKSLTPHQTESDRVLHLRWCELRDRSQNLGPILRTLIHFRDDREAAKREASEAISRDLSSGLSTLSI